MCGAIQRSRLVPGAEDLHGFKMLGEGIDRCPDARSVRFHCGLFGIAHIGTVTISVATCPVCGSSLVYTISSNVSLTQAYDPASQACL